MTTDTTVNPLLNCPSLERQGRTEYLCLGGSAWRTVFGWRFRPRAAAFAVDVTDPRTIGWLNERAGL
jgi:hypothetical protein